MITALTSISASPGVSTTAVAWAYTNERRTVIVEADTTGGSPILAGVWRGRHAHDASVLSVAAEAPEDYAQAILRIALPLPETEERWLLPAMALEIARAKLKLPNPKMGTAPCTGEGCVGRVGVPTWFWTQAWTSTSVSATAGPHTVTITARPSKVVWSLGDGQAVTCTSAGTKYEEWRGFASSPDCGLPNGYKKMGHYTVTATMTWQVSWTGAANGSETMTTSDSAQVAIGEVQAIVES